MKKKIRSAIFGIVSKIYHRFSQSRKDSVLPFLCVGGVFAYAQETYFNANGELVILFEPIFFTHHSFGISASITIGPIVRHFDLTEIHRLCLGDQFVLEYTIGIEKFVQESPALR